MDAKASVSACLNKVCISSHLASESILCDYLVVIFHLTCSFPEDSVSTETWEVTWINVVVLKLVCTQSMVYMFLLLIIWPPAMLILLGKKYCLCKSFGFCCKNVSWEGSRFIQVHIGLKITDIHFRMLVGTAVYEPQQHRECRCETKGQWQQS